jgi:hypothetical protein
VGLLLSRRADTAGNLRDVSWGGAPLPAPDTNLGTAYVTLFNSAGVAVDTITDSSDGKVEVIVANRNYVWDTAGLAWVKQVGSAGGVEVVAPQKATTTAVTSVAGSAANQTLLASNSARLGATIFNDQATGGPILYVKLGATASTSSYTVQLTPNSYYEVPFSFSGQIDGIWASAAGNARITELT